mmetsp:Transcript_42271/g.106514  ORF Transcript_42271/g.106514 Transcript_42271/m.106514 type:complete len:218 (-) Transcript_42271:3812-4465(-)
MRQRRPAERGEEHLASRRPRQARPVDVAEAEQAGQHAHDKHRQPRDWVQGCAIEGHVPWGETPILHVADLGEREIPPDDDERHRLEPIANGNAKHEPSSAPPLDLWQYVGEGKPEAAQGRDCPCRTIDILEEDRAAAPSALVAMVVLDPSRPRWQLAIQQRIDGDDVRDDRAPQALPIPVVEGTKADEEQGGCEQRGEVVARHDPREAALVERHLSE